MSPSILAERAERLLPAEGETFAHAVATSRELAPEEKAFWLLVCESEGK